MKAITLLKKVLQLFKKTPVVSQEEPVKRYLIHVVSKKDGHRWRAGGIYTENHAKEVCDSLNCDYPHLYHQYKELKESDLCRKGERFGVCTCKGIYC